MKKFNKLLIIAVALIIAAAGFIPAAAYGSEAKQYSEGIIEYNLQKTSAESVQNWIDGELTLNAGVGSEWYIIALSNYGEYDFTDYRNALNDYLSKNEVGSASSRLKYALTFIAIGDKSNPYINAVINNSIGEQGIMSFIFGLHLLNNGCVCEEYSADEIIDELLSLQLTDGGFSVTGEYGDVDVTAMAVQALAVYCEENSAVKSAVDAALAFLSARQLENGGYSSYGIANPESAAQVIIALSALGIDACEDERFIKNGNTVFDGISNFLLADGSFCHKEGSDSDSMATAQVLSASIAYDNFTSGKSSFYIFYETKTVCDETSTIETESETTIPETVLTEKAIITETAVITETVINTESRTEIFSAAPSAPYTAKPDLQETDNEKSDSFSIAIIAVCVAAILICAVLFAAKKHKFSVIVIITAIAAVALLIIGAENRNTDIIGSVSININCDVIKNENKKHIPENGVILEETLIEIENGDTVYDVLEKACRENGILFSSNMGYIEGIANIYEMDFGKSSGWIYFVNEKSPSVGCGSYELSHGDKIEWHYTRELGEDLDIDFEKEYN